MISYYGQSHFQLEYNGQINSLFIQIRLTTTRFREVVSFPGNMAASMEYLEGPNIIMILFKSLDNLMIDNLMIDNLIQSCNQ